MSDYKVPNRGIHNLFKKYQRIEYSRGVLYTSILKETETPLPKIIVKTIRKRNERGNSMHGMCLKVETDNLRYSLDVTNDNDEKFKNFLTMSKMTNS